MGLKIDRETKVGFALGVVMLGIILAIWWGTGNTSRHVRENRSATSPGLPPLRAEICRPLQETSLPKATSLPEITALVDETELDGKPPSGKKQQQQALTVADVALLFGPAITGERSKDIFNRKRKMRIEPGRWLPDGRKSLLVTVNVPREETCHAEGWHNDFVGVVDAETHKLLGRVYHVQCDGATRRVLRGKEQSCVLYVTAGGNQGYLLYEAIVLRFVPNGLKVTKPFVTKMSRELVIETAESGETLILKRKHWDDRSFEYSDKPDSILKVLQCDPRSNSFCGNSETQTHSDPGPYLLPEGTGRRTVLTTTDQSLITIHRPVKGERWMVSPAAELRSAFRARWTQRWRKVSNENQDLTGARRGRPTRQARRLARAKAPNSEEAHKDHPQ